MRAAGLRSFFVAKKEGLTNGMDGSGEGLTRGLWGGRGRGGSGAGRERSGDGVFLGFDETVAAGAPGVVHCAGEDGRV